MPETLEANLYRGMPHVELTQEENVLLHKELERGMTEKAIEAPSARPISISLESLDVDLQHNQGFGMIIAGTGCVSSVGGPSC